MPRTDQTIAISTGTILKGLFLAILLLLLYFLQDVLVIVLFSIIIASAIEPVVHWFSKFKIPRLLSVLLIYAVALLVLVLVLYLIIPVFFGDIVGFFSNFLEYLNTVLGPGQELRGPFDKLPPTFVLLLKGSVSSLEQFFLKFSSGLFRAAGSLFGGFVSFWLVIILSFYFSIQEHGIERFLMTITPEKHETRVLRIWKNSQLKMGRWLQAQFLLSLIVGVLVFVGLTLFGVQYSLLLALVAAVFEIIPGLGPIIASIPAIIIAFVQKPSLALVVVVIYTIVQQIENHAIIPLIMRRLTGVPSVVVIIALLVGGSLGGVVGMLLAVPLAVVVIEIMSDVARIKIEEKEIPAKNS